MATQPKPLTFDEVAAIAESVGLPGVTFAQIARGESSLNPGAIGKDPGGTRGLGLWQITTGFNDDVIAKYGGRERLLTDPVANAKAAKEIYDRQGLGAWYGTKYVTGKDLHYKGGASPAPVPGRTAPAGGPTMPAPPAPAGHEYGPSGDYASPLAQLLGQEQQQAPASSPIAAPSKVALPQGFRELASSGGPRAEDGASAASSLLETLRGGGPGLGTSGLVPAANGPESAPVTERVAERVTRQRKEGYKGEGIAGYPLGARGKVIGTPGAGTHTLGNWQSDNAVDIEVPEGTPMVALQDGVVVKVRQHPQDGGRFAGDQITIRGANGNMYFYAHGIAAVKPGQQIKRGEQLGVTGSANGVPHLHFGQMRGDPRRHAGS